MPQISPARLAVCFVFVLLLNSVTVGQEPDWALVPTPKQMRVKEKGVLAVPEKITFRVPSDRKAWRRHLDFAMASVSRIGSFQAESADAESLPFVDIIPGGPDSKEGYRLEVGQSGIRVETRTLKGLARATATLSQLLGSRGNSLPYLEIVDAPTTSYRNFMIDMGRNPHSIGLLKEMVDLLWYYKVDSLHLHLTDDQRFAFPSREFPDLWDGKISWEEFRELDKYASVRGVTLIPELEVPGHSGILRSKYPEVFGKTAAELAGSEVAIGGIKKILDEMMEVFPSSPYIHIGGDEAFGVPEELQRDLINELHRYLDSKGRQTIVWEGPRPGEKENRVHKDVIHINWRTINYPADEMLADGYRVVNAAWDPLYVVDHYPRINFTMVSPQHIFETLSLTRFKHVNPGISTYSQPISVESSDRLIGFCMPWWEGREENFFECNLPRLIPFAAIAWNPLEDRKYNEFARKAEQTEQLRRRLLYPIAIVPSGLVVASDGVFHEKTSVKLGIRWTAPDKDLAIRYTTDGTPPVWNSKIYEEPFEIDSTSTVRAALFVDKKVVGHGSRRNLRAVTPVKNLALGKPVSSSVSSGSPFSVGRVTDGDVNNLGFYLAYPAVPAPVQLTVDLEEATNVGRIVVHSYSISGSFEKFQVEVSEDGVDYARVGGQIEKPEQPGEPAVFRFKQRPLRFIRITSEGNKGYVFDSFSKVVEIQAYEN